MASTALYCLEAKNFSRTDRIASWICGQQNLTEDSLDVTSENERATDRASVSSNSTPQSQIVSTPSQSSDHRVENPPRLVDNEETSVMVTAQSQRGREQTLSYTSRRLNQNVTAPNRIHTNMSARQIDETIGNNLERVYTFFADTGANINARLNQPYITPGVTKTLSHYELKTSVVSSNNTTAGWQRYAENSGGYNVLRNSKVSAYYHHERHEQDTGGYSVDNTSQPADLHTRTYKPRSYGAEARSHVKHIIRAVRIKQLAHHTVDFGAAGAP